MEELESARRMRMFRGIAFIFGTLSLMSGLLTVTIGILFSSDSNGELTLFSLICGVVAGLLWHNSYKMFYTFKDSKGFKTTASYLEHVMEKDSEDKNSKLK
jgi:urea transporter